MLAMSFGAMQSWRTFLIDEVTDDSWIVDFGGEIQMVGLTVIYMAQKLEIYKRLTALRQS
jgi:hypothetical protein